MPLMARAAGAAGTIGAMRDLITKLVPILHVQGTKEVVTRVTGRVRQNARRPTYHHALSTGTQPAEALARATQADPLLPIRLLRRRLNLRLGTTPSGLRAQPTLAETTERVIMKRLLWPLAVVIVPAILGAAGLLVAHAAPPAPTAPSDTIATLKPSATPAPAPTITNTARPRAKVTPRHATRPRPHRTGPWAVVSAYYRDIDSHKYAKAWALIDSALATGQTCRSSWPDTSARALSGLPSWASPVIRSDSTWR